MELRQEYEDAVDNLRRKLDEALNAADYWRRAYEDLLVVFHRACDERADLEAAAEAEEYGVRTGMESDNSGLFPPHIVEWALLNKDKMSRVHCEICNEDGSTNDSLIEE